MDVVDIAADVIRERDQLKESVRELEADNVSLKGGWLRAQDRIAKAKAILEGFRVSTFGQVAAPVIDDVLEALEGK